MKNNWQIKKLGEVCDIIGGGTPSKSNHNFYDGDIFWATVRDMKNDLIVDTECKITPDAVKNSSTNIIPKGNVIIASRVGLGKVCFLNHDTAINQDLRGIIPKKTTLQQQYLFLWLKSIARQIEKAGTGMTVRGVTLPFLKNLEIPIPPIEEQKRIVKILDEVFEKIAKAKENTGKNLQNSKELFESYLQSVFTNPGEDWEEKRLGELLKLEYGKPLDKTDRDVNGKYPVYGANGEKSRTDKYYYDKATVIIGRKGSAGELNLTESKFWPLDVTYFVKFDDKKYNLQFIYFLLSTLKLTKLAKGVKPGINRNEVYSIKIFMPEIEEQKSIVAKLDALSEQTKKLEAIYKQKLADLDELKKSILKKAFEGEL